MVFLEFLLFLKFFLFFRIFAIFRILIIFGILAIFRSLRVITNLTNGSVGDPLYTLSDGLMVSGGILIGNCIVTNITLSASTTVEGTGNWKYNEK